VEAFEVPPSIKVSGCHDTILDERSWCAIVGPGAKSRDLVSGESVKYFVRRDPDGTVSHLVRIREVPDAGLWGEFFRDGQWHDSAAVMDYLLDPLLGDRISEQEATAIAADLSRRATRTRDLGSGGVARD